MSERIYLCLAHMSGNEEKYIVQWAVGERGSSAVDRGADSRSDCVKLGSPRRHGGHGELFVMIFDGQAFCFGGMFKQFRLIFC